MDVLEHQPGRVSMDLGDLRFFQHNFQRSYHRRVVHKTWSSSDKNCRFRLSVFNISVPDQKLNDVSLILLEKKIIFNPAKEGAKNRFALNEIRTNDMLSLSSNKKHVMSWSSSLFSSRLFLSYCLLVFCSGMISCSLVDGNYNQETHSYIGRSRTFLSSSTHHRFIY